MKTLAFLLTIVLTIVLVSCNSKKPGVPDNAINPDVMKNPASASSSSDQSSKLPKLEFKDDSHDFGTITQGEKVSYEFQFTNTGSGDLVISNATGSCGCTVPEWPRDPVHAGDKGAIKVTFDSEGKKG